MEVLVIASSSIDDGIGCWDLKSGKEQLRFKLCASPAGGLTAVGEKFLAASQLRNGSASSGSIFYWSWNKPQVEVRSFPVESVKPLTANYEGTFLVGGGSSGDIYFWEVNTGKLLKKWHGHYRAITRLVFSGDDSLLFSGSEDGSIKVWNLISLFDGFERQPGQTLYEHDFNEHTMPVTDIVVNIGNSNTIIVSASEDRTCKIWSLARRMLLKTIVFPSVINAVALDPSESVFYAGGRDGKIYIGAFNAVSDHGPQILGAVSEQSKAVTSLAYSAEENLLLSGSEDGVVCAWHPKSRGMVRTFVHGKGPVNNIQIISKLPLLNPYTPNKTQSSWKRTGSSLPPPLEKYESSREEWDGVVIVDPPTTSDFSVYSCYQKKSSSKLMDDLIKELEQQNSGPSEIVVERLDRRCRRAEEMIEQWQKKYEDLLQVCLGDAT